MSAEPLTSFVMLIVGIILGKAWERARWIEKFIDVSAVKDRLGKGKKDKKERAIAE